jgi:GT2 family glycosyltransferase
VSGRGAVPGRVYIVLVNWHGWRDTLECLESIYRQAYGEYRVVVCDNASGDDSLARIRAWAAGVEPASAVSPALAHLSTPAVPKPIGCVAYDAAHAMDGGGPDAPDARLVLIRSEHNLGFAGANNLALRYVLARGDADFVWLLNNDTVIDAGALAAMVELACSDASVGMVGSRLLYYDEPAVIQAAGGGRLIAWQGRTVLARRGEPDDARPKHVAALGYITGASLLARIELVRDIGLMDERYFLYSEEVDWCVRARQHGWRLGYAPASRVWHKEGRSVGPRSEASDYYGVRSALLLVRKFYPRLLPLAALYHLYRSVLPKLVRRQPARLRAVLRAYRDALWPTRAGADRWRVGVAR